MSIIREATASGTTIDDAREAAVALLNPADHEDVQVEIIDLPQKKTLGLFGGAKARVRVYIEADEPVKPAIPKPAEKPKATPAKPEAKPAALASTTSAQSPKQPRPPQASRAERSPHTERQQRPMPAPEVIVTRTAAATQFLREVTEQMGFSDIVISSETLADGVMLSVSHSDPEVTGGLGALIGRRGETMDALQYLATLVANRAASDDFLHIGIDIENYREKRTTTLQQLAQRTASYVRKSHRSRALEPMNPYERRIIHTAVQDMPGLASWSIGQGDARQVVIGFARDTSSSFAPRSNAPRPYNNDRNDRRNDRAPKSDSNAAPLYGKIK